MKILVSAASKHGATYEIADRIAETLAARGLDVTVARPDQVDIPEYDSIVLGSAVYAGHWLKEARRLADRIAAGGRRHQVWLFSSGPIGDPPKPDEDPVDVASLIDSLDARGHKVFAGRLEKSRLTFAEKAVMVALRAPEGDFRDWDAVSAWADEIADSLAGTPAVV